MLKSVRSTPLRSMLLACALSFGMAAVAVPTNVAFAQDKKAEKGPSVGLKVAKPLKAAQDLMAAKNWKEAKVKIDEAQAVDGKNAYENYAINEMMAVVQANLNDFAGAAKGFEATLNSEFLPADSKTGRLKSIAQLYYQVKNYPKVIQYGPLYLKESPNDAEMQVTVGQAYYLSNDFPNASKYLKNAIEASEKADKAPKEDWLQLLQSAEYEQNNTQGLIKALMKTIRNYPQPKYWDQLITLIGKEVNDSGKLDLEIYRIRMATNAKLEADELREMAELAIQAGLPGEAQTVMAKAATLGAKTERDTRLTNMAKTQATADKASLPQSEATAKGAATGEPLVKNGEAYLTYDNPAKAIELIKAGIAKGPKDLDRAKLRLGVSLIAAKQPGEAKKTFSSITPTSPYFKLGELWAITAK